MQINRYGNGSMPRDWTESVTSQHLVVLAASAGGLQALIDVLSPLPPDFPAAIAVVQHRGLQFADLLPKLLDRRTALKVRHAEDGDLLERGTVYICPPGMHMTAEHCVRLVEGPKLNYVRPSADLMFMSVARAYGDRAIGVVLSGTGSDGTAGCLAIYEAGGTVVAQEPASSAYAGMPAAAIARGRAELILPVEHIGDALRRLVNHRRSGEGTPPSPSPSPSPAAAPAITVLLADDHRILLDGLRTLLEGEEDIEVIAEAEDGRAAVQLARELSPDVVVMDIAMPDLNGIDATRRIKADNPHTSVVALSARADAQAAGRILEAGALGYLCKNAAFSELARAIRAVAARQPYLNPPVAAVAAGGPLPAAAADGDSAFARLTEREREIVQLMAEGKASDQIALLLGMGIKTVEVHGRRVMEKLGIDNLPGLTRYAIREGLTSLDL
jgi:chemotaxis response regulator CheB